MEDFFFKKGGNYSNKLFVCTHPPLRSCISSSWFATYLVLKENEVRWRYMNHKNNKTCFWKIACLPFPYPTPPHYELCFFNASHGKVQLGILITRKICAYVYNLYEGKEKNRIKENTVSEKKKINMEKTCTL